MNNKNQKDKAIYEQLQDISNSYDNKNSDDIDKYLFMDQVLNYQD